MILAPTHFIIQNLSDWTGICQSSVIKQGDGQL